MACSLSRRALLRSTVSVYGRKRGALVPVQRQGLADVSTIIEDVNRQQRGEAVQPVTSLVIAGGQGVYSKLCRPYLWRHEGMCPSGGLGLTLPCSPPPQL
jgi:hypothetical protein